MSEFGERLSQAREEKGITIEQAEADTHIRRGLLLAIEQGRYDELPGEVYGRGLIHNYARYLGMDPESAVSEYVRYTGHTPIYVPTVLNEPLESPQGRARGWVALLVVLVLMLVGGAYLARAFIQERGMRVESLWPLVISTPVVGAPPTTPLTPDAGGMVDAGAQTPASTPVAVADRTPAQRSTPTAIPLPTPRPTVVPTQTPVAGVYIEAMAIAPAYVEVVTDGERIFAGTMGENETAEWRADQAISLRIGNAGGLLLVVNGTDVGALGASGQVLDVEYTVDNLPGQ